MTTLSERPDPCACPDPPTAKSTRGGCPQWPDRKKSPQEINPSGDSSLTPLSAYVAVAQNRRLRDADNKSGHDSSLPPIVPQGRTLKLLATC